MLLDDAATAANGLGAGGAIALAEDARGSGAALTEAGFAAGLAAGLAAAFSDADDDPPRLALPREP